MYVSKTIIPTAGGQNGSFVSAQASNLRLRVFSPLLHKAGNELPKPLKATQLSF